LRYFNRSDPTRARVGCLRPRALARPRSADDGGHQAQALPAVERVACPEDPRDEAPRRQTISRAHPPRLVAWPTTRIRPRLHRRTGGPHCVRRATGSPRSGSWCSEAATGAGTAHWTRCWLPCNVRGPGAQADLGKRHRAHQAHRAERDRAELVVPGAPAHEAGRAVPGVQVGAALRQPFRQPVEVQRQPAGFSARSRWLSLQRAPKQRRPGRTCLLMRRN
jgi:hypothetical protein